VRVSAQGTPVWTKTERAMAADWNLQGTVWYAQTPPQLVMYAGFNPVSPTTDTTDGTFAVGDFGGGSGGRDIAVSYAVGTNGTFPFTAAGTTLTHQASFVEVLSGRDGHRLWSKAYPGIVSELVSVGGGLVVGDESGPAWDTNAVPEQGDSRSNLSYLTFAAGGAPTIRWTFTKDVPWAQWLSVVPAAGGIAVAWTDTPLGLGSPRPADGHVLLLDKATGRAKFDVETPDYPRILLDDPAHGRVLAGEEVDPTDSLAWRLTAYDPATGARKVLSTTPNQFLSTLTVGDHGPKDAAYFASAVGVDPASGNATGSAISGLNADGGTRWSTPAPAAYAGDVPAVGGAALAPTHHETLVVTTQAPRQPSDADPMGPYKGQLLALDSQTGAIRWQHSGAVATGLAPAMSGDTIDSVAADDTLYGYNAANGQTTNMQPLLGDVYGAVQADVNGDGVKDVIAGGISRGVFAIDGRPSADGAPHYLWTATVQGMVHQITLVAGGTQVLVAATSGWDLLDVRTGRVVASHASGVGDTTAAVYVPAAGSQPAEILVPTHDVTAYSTSGSVLWTWKPSRSVVKFSDVSVDSDGHALAEYGTAAGDASPQYGAVALNLNGGGVAWNTPADSTVTGASFLDSVYASPDIPGSAAGHEVAYAWQVKDNTLIEIRDSRTGAVLNTHLAPGQFGHRMFSAAPGQGLLQAHMYGLTRLMPDGVTWADISTFTVNDQAAFAKSATGADIIATVDQGIITHPQSYVVPGNDFPWGDEGKGPQLDDSYAMTLDGDQLVGFAQDVWTLDLDLAWNNAGYYFGDSRVHGISVNTIGTTGAAAAVSNVATQPTMTSRSVSVPAATIGETALGDPISGTGWGDGRAHSDAVVTPASPDSGSGIRGYIPAQLQHHLALTGDGAGQTIAIVDAFDHPTIAASLATFDAQFGLPAADLTVQPMPGVQPDASGSWDAETSLDVEWVHAIAPKAKLVLVEAATSIDSDMYAAVDAAAALHPAAVSMSWGQGGEFSGESFYDHHCALTDSVCVESTGDSGNPSGAGPTMPNVLAIGGTTESLDAQGNTTAPITAWRGSGGGVSFFTARPSFQDGFLAAPHRGVPDVSALADPRTGVAVYVATAGQPGQWMEVGGTSLAAPIWSAILAATDGLRATAGRPHLAAADGSVFRAVYSLGTALVDVTSGSNGNCPATECSAGPGYDTVTGLGSPAPGVDKVLAAK
jgi:hypothetical protein